MIGFFDLLGALRHRIRIVTAIGAGIFLCVFAIALILPRQYAPSASILVDMSQADPTDDKAKSTPDVSIVDTVIGTQADILRSSAVLGEVARKAGMLNDSQMGDTPDERLQNSITLLSKRLQIDTDKNKSSSVIRLTLLGKDPVQAARIVNLIVDVYLSKQVELRTMPARTNARWFDARTREVRQRYELAQKRLSDFQRQHGIVGVDRMDLEADKARSLSVELVQAQGEAAAARSRAGSANLPEVATTTIVQDLEREAGIQAGKVAEMSRTLGPNHPDMKAATAQLQALQASLAQARVTQASALSGASSAASRREADLRSRLADQQARMIALSGVQDQLMVLQRDVDAARQTYDTVRQRFNEAALKSEVSQANASLLDHATPPILPAKPNLLLWFMAAVILGGFSGVAFAGAQELLQPRVRTAGGVANMTDLDVIIDMTSGGATRNQRSSFLTKLFKRGEMA